VLTILRWEHCEIGGVKGAACSFNDAFLVPGYSVLGAKRVHKVCLVKRDKIARQHGVYRQVCVVDDLLYTSLVQAKQLHRNQPWVINLRVP
jgi:hypothetical protein